MKLELPKLIGCIPTNVSYLQLNNDKLLPFLLGTVKCSPLSGMHILLISTILLLSPCGTVQIYYTNIIVLSTHVSFNVSYS